MLPSGDEVERFLFGYVAQQETNLQKKLVEICFSILLDTPIFAVLDSLVPWYDVSNASSVPPAAALSIQ